MYSSPQPLKKSMFTGIIEEIGQIEKVTSQKGDKTFIVSTKKVVKGKKIGDSITVNGACTTVTKLTKNSFEFVAIPETLQKTNLDFLEKGTQVNLESSLTLNKSLDGHLVQGHVDARAKVASLQKSTKGTRLEIALPKEISKYVALKGSITINGVSLTVSVLKKSSFCVDLIPHTLKETNLGLLKKNDIVNLEIDLIARYLARLLNK